MANPNWIPGVSGNPNGRPPKDKTITGEIKKILEELLPTGMTKSQALAQGIVDRALDGDPSFVKIAMQYVDGMPVQKQILVGEEGAPGILIEFSSNGQGKIQPNAKTEPGNGDDAGSSA